VETLTTRERRIHERLRHVDPATRAAQHALHEVAYRLVVEDGGGEFGAPRPCDEHLAGLVDPQLLDGRVVEVSLEGTETSHRVKQALRHAVGVRQRGDETRHRAVVVVRECFRDQGPERGEVLDRIDSAPTCQFADLVLEQRDGVVHVPPWR